MRKINGILLGALVELVDHLDKAEGGKWLNNRPGERARAALRIAKKGG